MYEFERLVMGQILQQDLLQDWEQERVVGGDLGVVESDEGWAVENIQGLMDLRRMWNPSLRTYLRLRRPE